MGDVTHSLVESLQAMWHRYRCQLHHPRGGVSATRLSRAAPPPTNPSTANPSQFDDHMGVMGERKKERKLCFIIFWKISAAATSTTVQYPSHSDRKTRHPPLRLHSPG